MLVRNMPGALKVALVLSTCAIGLSRADRATVSPSPSGSGMERRSQVAEASYTAGQRACLEKLVQTANAKAIPEARAVLAYLKQLPHEAGGRVISGQYVGAGKYSGLKDIEEIQKKTGRWVGMLGIDYALMHTATTTANPLLIRYWEQGGLATISFHALNPQSHGFGSVKKRNVNLRDLQTPGTKAYKNWMADLDIVAEGLSDLQRRNIVVLWRPFHEMNKNFFWWGNRDVSEFVDLWRRTFDYLTNTKGLNNLLWVYSPYQAPDTAKYYPGDEYVDIVAMDAYETNPENIQGYEALAAIDKPFGFAEYGPSGKLLFVVPIIDKNVDYYGIFKTIRRKFPKTSFIHAWGGGWGFQDHRNIQSMMTDPAMITREQVAWRSICAK